MKNILVIACILAISVSSSTFGQQITETSYSLGVSKPFSRIQQPYWGDAPAPMHLLLDATKSWYNNVQKVSLRKEAGLNLQYTNINLENGGLGASNHYTGSIFSLFAEGALLARFRILDNFALGIGPEAEILLLGKNNLNNSFYSMLNYPNSTYSNTKNTGLNRNYFKQPSYGIKLSLYETGITDKTTIGINASFLWTKSELADFYAAHYLRLSLCIGFLPSKEELTPEPTN